jgi:endonuclease/exonuclease/phosphatase family metal-dependent hydrolase
MRIRVATLNVWALPPPLADQVPERMQAIAAELGSLNADVVALQEVWTAGARETLIAGGRRAGLSHCWHTEASLGGSGLLVLSRHPIRRTHFQRYSLRGLPEEIGGDFYGGKGFARLEIESPDGAFALVNTHLHARYGKRVAHEYRALRTGQIVELALGSREVELPLVVLGDFNFRERDAGHKILTGLTGLRDVAAELDRRRATVQARNAYRSGSKPDRRIDYVYTRDGAFQRARPRWIELAFDAPIRIGDQSASFSDHAGLLAEIEFTRDRWASPGRPRADAIELARSLLVEGREEARRRQKETRTWAGLGIGGALVASAGLRGLSATRRGVLRGALRGIAFAALAPSLGLSVLSEVFVPDELRAFEDLSESLARVGDADRESLA